MNSLFDILPSYIKNCNFKFLEIDKIYVMSLVIKELPNNISFSELIDSIPKQYEYDLSFFIQKEDTVKVLKELTYNISKYGSEIKTTNDNQIDIDVLNQAKDDARLLRKDIQVNNEQIFNLCILITVYSSSKDDIFKIVKQFQSKLFSKELYSNILNFRHLDAYLLNLPFNNYTSNILKTNSKLVTTKALSNMFPFCIKTIFDSGGVIFGYSAMDNKLCSINIFSQKYLNSNMCIFGSSGAGKSYFTKLLILKHYVINKYQYIIDPEGEYIFLVTNLKGEYIDFKNTKKCINLFDILEEDLTPNFFYNKVEKITHVIIKLLDITDAKRTDIIKNAVIKTYNDFGIYNDLESMYICIENDSLLVNKKLKFGKYFPNINDLLLNINIKSVKNEVEQNIINMFPCICNTTNINYDNKIIAFNYKNINVEKASILVEFTIDMIMNKISKGEQNSIIYIDEVWKYISVKNKNTLSEKIFTLYKTIRKNRASIVTITQDISDLFSIDNGTYGKSILNNSNFKVFFKLDYSDTEILEKLSIMNKDSLNQVISLNKSQSILGIKDNIIKINIKSNDYEKRLIEEVLNENNSGTSKSVN